MGQRPLWGLPDWLGVGYSSGSLGDRRDRAGLGLRLRVTSALLDHPVTQ